MILNLLQTTSLQSRQAWSRLIDPLTASPMVEPDARRRSGVLVQISLNKPLTLLWPQHMETGAFPLPPGNTH